MEAGHPCPPMMPVHGGASIQPGQTLDRDGGGVRRTVVITSTMQPKQRVSNEAGDVVATIVGRLQIELWLHYPVAPRSGGAPVVVCRQDHGRCQTSCRLTLADGAYT